MPAGEAESTVARQFVADQKAHAIPSLSAIYKELQAPGIQAFLICVAGPDRGRGMPVGAEPVTIGRGAHNVFQVHDPGASVTQAQIVWEDGRLFVRDCMSKNGTFVNNARVEQAELSNCDVIAFGDTRILVAMG
ncbi:MAG: hypothetical protein KatS3mg102_0298 [Planctomycetota bacterium]|nr:MAG: hypothetical protein KatS3mg102_0298 [Planctomycetota bacterium]